MVWREVDAMTLRGEFVDLAEAQDCNVSLLCRRFGISRKTGYKWLQRGQAQEPMSDRSRRPLKSPWRTSSAMETAVVAMRRSHPAWGGRKIAARLHQLGADRSPAASTVTHILRRHGLLDPKAQENAAPWQRFEHPHPNDLWQMDFKGHFATGPGKCHGLTVLDDCAFQSDPGRL